MIQDRKSEWLDGADWDLFERQYREPYRINLSFFSWLESLHCIQRDKGLRLGYLGAGMGANLYHFSKLYPGNQCVGLELNSECVRKGNERLKQLYSEGTRIEQADWYNLPNEFVNRFDGLFSLATLSWLPDFDSAAECLARLNPKWIAATSLFYNGPVDATIKTSDYSKPIGQHPSTDKFYNIYSIPRIREYFVTKGYNEFHSQQFEIDIDLPRPSHGGMGTYTETLIDGRRLQISGPLLMNWHFILARRND